MDKELVLRNALQMIKDKQGRVCEQFEICTHVACHSSYASWFIADAALSLIEGVDSSKDLLYDQIINYYNGKS